MMRYPQRLRVSGGETLLVLLLPAPIEDTDVHSRTTPAAKLGTVGPRGRRRALLATSIIVGTVAVSTTTADGTHSPQIDGGHDDRGMWSRKTEVEHGVQMELELATRRGPTRVVWMTTSMRRTRLALHLPISTPVLPPCRRPCLHPPSLPHALLSIPLMPSSPPLDFLSVSFRACPRRSRRKSHPTASSIRASPAAPRPSMAPPSLPHAAARRRLHPCLEDTTALSSRPRRLFPFGDSTPLVRFSLNVFHKLPPFVKAAARLLEREWGFVGWVGVCPALLHTFRPAPLVMPLG
ncbi:hypothetical protein K438DRAFT_183090 [Mycena galopus ATCC 62051]|nr:hypothetical protein K438DRAFT_183090 [Mycena galopus ATCC 62051]